MASNQRVQMLLFGTISLCLMSNTTVFAQAPHPFGGITLIKVNNPVVRDALNSAEFLLTVVAGNQSYVVGTRHGSGIGATRCVTWMGEEPDGSGQMVVGSGEQWRYRDSTRRYKDTEICSEFTLRRLGTNQVVFTNKQVRAVLPVLENHPIVPIDWNSPSISHFRFKGDGLGIVTLDEVVEITNRGVPRPYSRAQVIERLQRPGAIHIGTLSGFGSSWLLDDGSAQISFAGLLDVDRLISEGQAEILYARFLVTQKALIPKTLFMEALLERYGAATATIRSGRGFTLIWAHDLQGRLVSETAGSIPGLQALVEFGYSTIYPQAYSSDLGPWGFGTILSVVVPGFSDEVESYEVHIRHGHALAHQRFSGRLGMISDIQETLKNQSKFIPEF